MTRENILSINLSELKNSIILHGVDGSKRHDLIREIAKKNNIEVYNLENINYENLLDVSEYKNLLFNIIDGDSITEKEQNILLKFIEEPNKNIYNWIICENIDKLLDTVKNRCLIIELDNLSKSELEKYIDGNPNPYDSNYLEICNSVGKIEKCSYKKYLEICSICQKLLQKIKTISISNLLYVSTILEAKENKFYINIFSFVIKFLIKESYEHKYNDFSVEYIDYVLKCISELTQSIGIKTVDVCICLNNFLLSIKKFGEENDY